jgi:hypothetical protein
LIVWLFGAAQVQHLLLKALLHLAGWYRLIVREHSWLQILMWTNTTL